MIGILGLAIAIALPLLVTGDDDRWLLGGTVLGGLAVALVGLRVGVGEKHGREILGWGSLFVAIAAIVVTVIAN